jgi:sn-glycerol 3-phosphate transport system substrate-binding protein
MKKMIIAVLLAALAGTWCFATGKTESGGTRPEVVKLQVWYALGGAAGETFAQQAQEFDTAHPEIELELTYSGSYADTATKVSAALLSGDEPDVAVMAAGQLYTGARGDFSMENLVKDAAFNVNDIYPGMMEYAKFDGRIAAIPYGISTQVIYYNKNITTAAGLDLEKNPPKSWDEFLRISKTAMQQGNVNRVTDFYGFDTSDSVWLFKSMLGQSNNEVVRKVNGRISPVFNDAKGVEAANFWKRMIDEQIMPAGQHNNAENKFLAGNYIFPVEYNYRVSERPKAD